jgi:hypothetical protein
VKSSMCKKEQRQDFRTRLPFVVKHGFLNFKKWPGNRKLNSKLSHFLVWCTVENPFIFTVATSIVRLLCTLWYFHTPRWHCTSASVLLGLSAASVLCAVCTLYSDFRLQCQCILAALRSMKKYRASSTQAADHLRWCWLCVCTLTYSCNWKH